MRRTTVMIFLQWCIWGVVGTQPTLAQDSRAPSEQGLRLTLVFDVSRSTTGLTAVSQAGGVDLVERLDEERDLAQIIAFGDTVAIVQEFTSDRDQLKSSILRLQSKHTATSLFNAIYIAFRGAAKPDDDGRRDMIVVVSDGEDTSSMITEDNLKSAASSSAATFYAITFEPRRGSDVGVLRALAKTTGGEAFEPRDIREAEIACQQIGAAMDRDRHP